MRDTSWPLRMAIKICRKVGELPDRTSPDDNPDIMLVTADELQEIILDVLTESKAKRI